jgi:hypothetical protein
LVGAGALVVGGAVVLVVCAPAVPFISQAPTAPPPSDAAARSRPFVKRSASDRQKLARIARRTVRAPSFAGSSRSRHRRGGRLERHNNAIVTSSSASVPFDDGRERSAPNRRYGRRAHIRNGAHNARARAGDCDCGRCQPRLQGTPYHGRGDRRRRAHIRRYRARESAWHRYRPGATTGASLARSSTTAVRLAVAQRRTSRQERPVRQDRHFDRARELVGPRTVGVTFRTSRRQLVSATDTTRTSARSPRGGRYARRWLRGRRVKRRPIVVDVHRQARSRARLRPLPCRRPPRRRSSRRPPRTARAAPYQRPSMRVVATTAGRVGVAKDLSRSSSVM